MILKIACLREQFDSDADLIDAGVIVGTGFAPFRGGPPYHARSRGIEACIIRMRELAVKHARHCRPAAGRSLLSLPEESASST